MSLLETLRKGTDSTSTRLLIGVAVASFIVFTAKSGQQKQTSKYASVNGVVISASDFQYTYGQTMRQAERQANRNLTDEDRQELAVRVLQNLIEEEALVQEAERLGVTVSEEEVAREVVKIDAFHGEDGKFDQKTYEKLLKANGLSRAKFEEGLHRSLLAQKLADFASHAVVVTEQEVKDAYNEDGTTLDLTFIRLPEAAFLDSIVVSDADRDAFIQQNGDRLNERYKEAYDRFYNLPRRYQLRTILLRTDIEGTDEAAVQARADAVRAQAAAPGADFAALARRWSEDLTASSGGNLGLQAQAQLDPMLTAAADKAGVGKVSEVVKTSRGFQILLVEKIEDARVIPFDEAKNDLAVTMIREERAPKEIDAFAAQLVKAWQEGGAPPRVMAEEKHLAVDTTGAFSLSDPEIPRLGADPALRQQIATAKAGYVLPVPMKIKDTVMVIGVGSRTEADPAQFEASRGMIEGRLLAQRRSAFLQEWRSEVVSQAKVTRDVNLSEKPKQAE